MNISRKQALAMAALVTAGLAGGAAVLLGGRAGAPAAEAHAAEAAHPDAHTDEAPLVRLTAAQTAGIATAPVAPALLQPSTDFTGEIRFNEDRTVHVVPRLAGVAEAVPVTLGQQVRAGEVLARIASTTLAEQRSELLTAQRRQEAARAAHEREKTLWQDRISAEQDYQQARSALREADIAVDNARQKLAAIGAAETAAPLSRLDVRAPLAGTIVEKHLARGEAVREDAAVFTVSDLGSVWTEFAVAPKDLALVRVGQRVRVSSTAFDETAEGTVSYVGALLGEQTRTARARVTLANPQGAWRPGLFVTVRVLGAAQPLALAVAAEAIQTIEGRTTVFRAGPAGFEPVPVKTGRSDGRTVEVLAGLQAGDRVATGGAFILKAELGKAGAAHEH
ncbi:efflux RND transporter periplasmic adaptor subunit [Pelomonas sp. KK5]|uniref:efflux RND transporter periplasmic adaptor subunit n=1 Tax=Pelomonas sp. KK5 TaxID=1855730 RepID=UPI00097C5D80|nr:efflux RND transporter periplasmic adaptor subunit [Pelomonas sp. KK5]